VIEHAEKVRSRFQPLYDWGEPIKDKIEKIAIKMYGASGVAYTKQAEDEILQLEELGYGKLPVSMAKAPTSLSDDPLRAGRPRDFDVVVRSVIVSAGAGMVVPLLGAIMRMPGLPPVPQATRMDYKDGHLTGLLGG
jgi:formate--tetrahydrofolate ligase